MINIPALMQHIIDSKPHLKQYDQSFQYGYLCGLVDEIRTRFPEVELLIKEHADSYNYKEL